MTATDLEWSAGPLTQSPPTRSIPAPGVSVVPHTRTFYARSGKRVFDVAVALPLLVVLTPLMLVTALVVRLSMGRNVVFRQYRVGRSGVPFLINKFRTMRHPRPRESRDIGPEVGLAEPGRVTAVGRWMRRLSVDELPQLWNVVRGEMSVVGPRPEVYAIAEEKGTVFHPRHLVRPGLTGLWQISADRSRPLHECMGYDIEYMGTMSLANDVKIVAKTFRVLFRRTGI